MVRWRHYSLACILLFISGLAGCGSTRSTSSAGGPATISLTPASASLEMGQTQQLTATAQDSAKHNVTVIFTYSSSNTAALTISNGGLACAGSWDSLVLPVRCTPGPAGVVTVTASSGGVVSPPVTFYVHSHIDNISIAPIQPLPVNNCNPANSRTVGISQNQTVNYEATAFSQGNDITANVGPFVWAPANAIIVKTDTAATGLLTNQMQATALAPGLTQIAASAGGVTSSAVDFLTCPVQSIVLGISGGTGNTISFAKAGTATISATVTDSALPTPAVLTNLTSLTWSSSDPLVASAAADGNIGGTVSGQGAGGATIIASCSPPSCNSGIVPAQSIYPNTSISVTVAPTGTPATTSAYAATTQCVDNFGCTSSVVQIAVPGNTVGKSGTLPNTPNSFVFDHQGKNAYLGSKNGLMVFVASNLGGSSNPITVHGNVTGKVLAVSHNGNKVIVSDTNSNPNQVFIFDTTATTGAVVNLLISGATAAAFSPDDMKTFIVAGNNLYVYSTLEPLQTIGLGAPAKDAAFLPQGGFAEVAGGANSGLAITNLATTCPSTSSVGTSVNTNGTPTAVRALIDGTHVLALDPPNIDVLTIAPPSGNPPCPPLTTGMISSSNLGQGQFTPLKFLVSSDGSKAYVLAQNFGTVLVYDVVGGTSSAIPLNGNTVVQDADLTLDGTLLYVAAKDGNVHAINTVGTGAGVDVQTITFGPNFNFCNNVTYTCTPDLLAVQP